MAKNQLQDLTDHLFAQLERLGDEELTDEALSHEVKRAESMVSVAGAVLESGRLALRAAELRAEHLGDGAKALPRLLQERQP